MASPTIDAMRVIARGRDGAILGFRSDDEDQEMTVFFAAKGFAAPERLFRTEEAIRDVFFDGRSLWAVDRHHVHRARGKLTKATKEPFALLPDGGHVHINAIAGTSPRDIYAVGEGILRWDGRRWTPVAYEGHELLCAAAGHGAVYAAGDRGTVVELRGGEVRRVASRTTADLITIHVRSGTKASATPTLSVGGDGVALQGSPKKLTRLRLPKNAEAVVGIADFNDKTYWALVGNDDGDGTGLFVQRGSKLVLVDARIAGQLSAAGAYLFVAGEGGALRFDGATWKVLGVTWNEKKRQLDLVAGTVDDIEEG